MTKDAVGSNSSWQLIHALLFLLAGSFLLAEAFASGSGGDFSFAALALTFAVLAAVGRLGKSVLRDWFELLSPVTLVCLTYVFYFFVVLAVNPDTETFTEVYVACTCCLSILFVTVLWPWSSVLYRAPRAAYKETVGKGPVVLFLLSGLGWVFLIAAAYLGGVGSLVNVYADPLRMRVLMSNGGMAYFKLICDFLVLMPPQIAAMRRFSLRHRSLEFPVLLLSGVFYSLASGSRSMTVSLLINVLLLRQFLKKPVRPLVLALSAGLVVPFVALMGIYRNISTQGSQDLAAIARIVSDLGPAKVVLLFVSRLDASYYFNLLIRSRDRIHLTYGVSYFTWPLQAIPRAVWPGKPLLPNTSLTYRLVTGPSAKVTFDFSIFGESYLNFGLLGIVSGALAVALFTLYMQKRYDRLLRTKSLSDALFFVTTWGFPMFLVVNGVVGAATVFCLQLCQFWVARRLFISRQLTHEP